MDGSFDGTSDGSVEMDGSFDGASDVSVDTEGTKQQARKTLLSVGQQSSERVEQAG
jgi:hypothetical protein